MQISDVNQSIADRFATILQLHPNRLAVQTQQFQWSYHQLNVEAQRYAGALNTTNEQTPVAILAEHDAPLIAALLGVIMTGKPYLVIDPEHPLERIQKIVAHSGAQALITDQVNHQLAQQLLNENLTLITANTKQPTNISHRANPTSICSINYTSGSTGQPKGAYLTHRTLLHRIYRVNQLAEITPDDRLTLLTSCTFAASLTSIFGALLNGAALFPYDLKKHSLNQLPIWLEQNKITVYHSVPTVFRRMLQTLPSAFRFAHLRLVRLGGETILQDDFTQFRQRMKNTAELMLAYSTTETGVICHQIFNEDSLVNQQKLSVGYESHDITIHLLDNKDHQVKEGEIGEIVVFSEYLAEGYWRDKSATRKAFIFPFKDQSFRYYKTGDLGRRLNDGTLEHIGRKDEQIKIRGHRVEVAEIEAALLALPAVQQAAVTLIPASDSGSPQLVAFIVFNANKTLSSAKLRATLHEQLPIYMTPHKFIVMDNIPVTSTGKIDRKALQQQSKSNSPHTSDYRKPKESLEIHMAGIWQSVLLYSPIGLDDNFFDLGGDSIQAAQICARIEKSFAKELPISQLFETPTIALLCARLTREIYGDTCPEIISLRKAKSSSPFYCVHGVDGAVYSLIELAEAMTSEQAFLGIQSPAFNGNFQVMASMDTLAAHYVERLHRSYPEGPLILGGYCMGGIVALAMEKVLIAQGREVKLMILIDVPYIATNYEKQSLSNRFLKQLQHRLRVQKLKSIYQFSRRIKPFRQWQYSAKFRRSLRKLNQSLLKLYPVQDSLAGDCIIFKSAESDREKQDQDRRLLLAKRLNATKNLVTVPGDHSTCLQAPCVVKMAEHIQTHCAAINQTLYP